MRSLLTSAVIEVEQHVSRSGWDQAPKLFALVETADLLQREPGLAQAMGLDASQVTPGSFTPVEQESLPADQPLDETLARIAWPDEVAGCALVVERLMLPPTAEEELPDGDEAVDWVTQHPERQDVRIAVGVLRDGTREAAVRLRSHDSDDAVLSGPDLVPGLADALAATLNV